MLTPLLMALTLYIPAETGPPRAAVERALTSLAADPVFKGLDLGANVRCEGAPLGAVNGDKLLFPASSAKLLSTAAALTTLPLDHRFTTAVVGEVRGQTLENAALVAGGDPTLTVEQLEDLAAQVKALGVTRIDTLTIDLGHFSAPTTAPGFDQKNTDAAYRPEVASLAVHSAAIMVTARPGAKVGDPVRVTIGPVAAGVRIDSTAKTVDGKRIDRLVIETRADKDGTRVVVSGELGVKAPPQGVKKRLFGAAFVAAQTFRKALENRGVPVSNLAFGAARPKLPILAKVQSAPIPAIAAQINKTSNNFMAESLFLQLGARLPGERGATWEQAQKRTMDALTALGLSAGSFEIVNGSGLYEATRVSAAGLATLLAALDPKRTTATPTAEARLAFWDSLAIAGTDGTLSHRLKGLEKLARGKTGTLDKAISLSGYVDHPRCRLAFAVIVNGAMNKTQGKVVARLDQLVRELAGVEKPSKGRADGKPKRRK
jgi:D-alanyl-D-alanine carboxypeptidase/D-alanyl-D-alanine-endopeptidase (penicillin-binding protein 4)